MGYKVRGNSYKNTRDESNNTVNPYIMALKGIDGETSIRCSNHDDAPTPFTCNLDTARGFQDRNHLLVFFILD